MSGAMKPGELDKLAALVNDARHNMAAVSVGMASAYHRGDYVSLPQLIERAGKASRLAESAVVRLVASGAKRPGVPVAADTLPLHLLDTPETRRLLAALDEAAKAAEAVDKQRGWIGSDGESNGWAETISGLAYELRQEIEGPRGKE